MRRTPQVERVVRTLLEGETNGVALAERGGMSAPTAYRVLARLRDAGYVTQRIEFGSLRKWYTLTDAGRALAQEWLGVDPTRVSRYRARPRYVEAVQWTGANLEEVRKLAGDMAQMEGDTLWIRTPDANERTAVGDWVTTGVHNAYRLEDDTFHEMYEVP